MKEGPDDENGKGAGRPKLCSTFPSIRCIENLEAECMHPKLHLQTPMLHSPAVHKMKMMGANREVIGKIVDVKDNGFCCSCDSPRSKYCFSPFPHPSCSFSLCPFSVISFFSSHHSPTVYRKIHFPPQSAPPAPGSQSSLGSSTQ